MNEKNINPVTARELLTEEFDPRIEVIPKLMYGGCYILAGPPKVGKSFLAMQIAHHVSTGQKLWDFPIEQKDVLFCALEDNHERLQRRYGKLSDYYLNDHLHFVTQAPVLIDGLADEISDFCTNKGCKLVIIDTLQMIRSTQTSQTAYGDDYMVLSILRSLAQKLNACVLTIHHTRKMDASDQFDLISGTNGIFGAVDGAMVILKKDRIQNEAQLICTGRDISDIRLNLSFNRTSCQWECNDVDTQPWAQPPDPFLEAINKIVMDCGGHWAGTPKALWEQLNDKRWPMNKVTVRLNVNVNRLLLEYNITYIHKRSATKMIYLDYADDKVSDCDSNAEE